jgi:hypothetical protein
MTTLYKVQHRIIGTGMFEDAMFTTKVFAERHMTALRNDGIDSTLSEVTLKKVGESGVTSKELYCALYNRQNYAESGRVLKTLPGVKHPKK